MPLREFANQKSLIDYAERNGLVYLWERIRHVNLAVPRAHSSAQNETARAGVYLFFESRWVGGLYPISRRKGRLNLRASPSAGAHTRPMRRPPRAVSMPRGFQGIIVWSGAPEGQTISVVIGVVEEVSASHCYIPQIARAASAAAGSSFIL
jgi:hypothetical protein